MQPIIKYLQTYNYSFFLTAIIYFKDFHFMKLNFHFIIFFNESNLSYLSKTKVKIIIFKSIKNNSITTLISKFIFLINTK